MPWQNQGGNGWSGGKNRGPWGQGPGGRGGGTPPDLEDILRRGQERLKDILPGGAGRTTWLLPLLAVAALWLYNSIYVVSPEQRGVVLSFGEYSRTTGPGLHFLLWPIETVERPRVETENLLKFGESSTESLMLSGDQNIVDMQIHRLVEDQGPEQFLFNVAAQEQLVRVVAESSMREIVGRTPGEEIRTRGRQVARRTGAAADPGHARQLRSGITVPACSSKRPTRRPRSSMPSRKCSVPSRTRTA